MPCPEGKEQASDVRCGGLTALRKLQDTAQQGHSFSLVNVTVTTASVILAILAEFCCEKCAKPAQASGPVCLVKLTKVCNVNCVSAPVPACLMLLQHELTLQMLPYTHQAFASKPLTCRISCLKSPPSFSDVVA